MTRRDFERQFKLLYMPLGMYALRMLDDSEAAEDAVQDAFVKAWEQIEEGREIANMKAWMYRCVRNVCVDQLRSRKEQVGVEECGDVAEDEIDTSERDARIWRAIDELPERCREIFLMSKRDGMTNDEIAQELNLSVKTVKNQMTKAFDRLRGVLGGGVKPFFLPFL